MLRRVRVTALLSLVLLIALLVAGCGGSEQADPFAGTWRMDSGDRVLFVISASGDTYTIVQGSPGAPDYVPVAELRRSGDKLSGDANISETDGVLTLSVGTDPTQLVLNFDGPKMNGPFDTTLTKVSFSTATPTPVP